MTQHVDEEPDEALCLCRKFVPAPKRLDYEQQVLNEKTGKLAWKTIMRAHQDCPFHGIVVVE